MVTLQRIGIHLALTWPGICENAKRGRCGAADRRRPPQRGSQVGRRNNPIAIQVQRSSDAQRLHCLTLRENSNWRYIRARSAACYCALHAQIIEIERDATKCTVLKALARACSGASTPAPSSRGTVLSRGEPQKWQREERKPLKRQVGAQPEPDCQPPDKRLEYLRQRHYRRR